MAQSKRRFNRRTILKSAVAAPLLMPSLVFGKDDAVTPSERIALGMIGVGMMGRGHLRVCLGYPEAQVVAACDVDRWRREDAKTQVEQAYAARQPSGSFKGCRTYNDLRELLASDDIDAVVIATGDNWHSTATVMAAAAGKDVYCEKPASKTIAEARAMIDACKRYGRVGQIGLQQRSTPEFIKACRLIHQGRIGKVKMVYVGHPGTSDEVNLPATPVPEGLDWDRWLGPAPWRPYNGRFHYYGKPPRVVPWHFCRDFGGGNLTSNTVHAFDVVQWGLGTDRTGPVEIIPPEADGHPSLTYKYANGVKLQVVDWKLDPAVHQVPDGWDINTRLQNFGALYVGDEGWIHVGRQGYLTAYPDTILHEQPGETDPMSPVSNHHQNWLECVKTRREPACDVSIGCRSTIVSHLGCIAHWTGRRLKWDPAGEKFVGDDEANRLRSRAMRPPWRI